MPLTSEAKRLLAETIRGTSQDPHKGLRARLVRAIGDEADRRYRLSVPLATAGLDEAHRRRRERLEAWLDERARAALGEAAGSSKAASASKAKPAAKPRGRNQASAAAAPLPAAPLATPARSLSPKERAALEAAKKRLYAEAIHEAAATLLNRLVLLRQLEARGLVRPPILTGGRDSKAYRELTELAPGLCLHDPSDGTEGYATLLGLVFDELALDLPGLYGDVGLTRLFPIPPAALRDVVERLDDPGLASAWGDDTTLGWVYQYWNDPDREALDAKIHAGGKIEPHEIASKTQMFTERYMVEWLLQNSLGLTWLAMCQKNGWQADALRVLPVLEARRADWRERRARGEAEADALMPVESELEDRWKYFVGWSPTAGASNAAAGLSLPAEAVANAPARLCDLRLLDPACGSGHFLVIAFDLLAALYSEEARHTGEVLTDQQIAEAILEHNLHGVDIDPRATQIAAAALYLKAKSLSKKAAPKALHLVAPALELGKLPPGDPALAELTASLEAEVGIPRALSLELVTALAGVDHLGSLLRVGEAVEAALLRHERALEEAGGQGALFAAIEGRPAFPAQQAKLPLGVAKATILEKIERFLERRSRADDLGLRLGGEQLASGVRFVRLLREGSYDVVVGNPPYQGLSKTARFDEVAHAYPRAKADLYAAFLERGLELVRPGGCSAMVTMRGWMFLGQFAELRKGLLHAYDLRALGDFDRGAFDEVPNEVLAVCAPVFVRTTHPGIPSVAVQPTPLEDKSYDRQRTNRKRAAVLAHEGRYEFDPRGFEVIDGEPIVYWWSKEFLAKYAAAPKLGDVYRARKGVCTGNDSRFTRKAWEQSRGSMIIEVADVRSSVDTSASGWVPTIMGGDGLEWIEPLRDLVNWRASGLEMKVAVEHRYGVVSKRVQSEEWYFRLGVAFAMIGSGFSGRAHRYRSVFGNMGSSVFPDDRRSVTCVLNRSESRAVLSSLNPGVHFEVGDVNRLPLFPIDSADSIFATLETAFAEHEAAREPSVEFRLPGRSAWDYAQAWAQAAVDRPAGAPLPPYEPVYVEAEPAAHVSYAIGQTLGRFDLEGGGVLAEYPIWLERQRMLFVSVEEHDSLKTPYAYVALHTAWNEHGQSVAPGETLRDYLRKGFFEYHRRLYENRPIFWPLSSQKRSYVAWVSIHAWQDDTLQVLLADHLVPTRRRLEGELADLRTARASASGQAKNQAERRYTELTKLLEELEAFIAAVEELAERGPPPPDDKTPPRERDARYAMDLDDGVMVNAAGLWPLLEPQWKDPKKWWKELATSQGKKDYDWSKLAARYFPTRVASKCAQDPSLAVAHGCFWRLFPDKAYAWELRLQDEIRADYTIDEPGSDEARARFLGEHAAEARELRDKEQRRREKKAKKESEADDGPLFGGQGDERDEAQGDRAEGDDD